MQSMSQISATVPQKRKRDGDDTYSERPTKLIWARYYSAPYTIPFVSEGQRTTSPTLTTAPVTRSRSKAGTNTPKPTPAKTQRPVTRTQRVPPTDALPSVDDSVFRKIPNEIVDCIIQALHPVDAACFALTSKENYQAVKEATGKLPKQLCPRNGSGFVCQLTIKARGIYRALLRQLALWMPVDDMVYCLSNAKAWRSQDLLKRDRIWKRRFFRDLANVRRARMASIKRLDKAQDTGVKRGRKSVRQRRRYRRGVPRTTAEQEWTDLIASSEASAGKGRRVLRPRD